jgi:multisubunit Na+/H+ antiporter MnhG subunit
VADQADAVLLAVRLGVVLVRELVAAPVAARALGHGALSRQGRRASQSLINRRPSSHKVPVMHSGHWQPCVMSAENSG